MTNRGMIRAIAKATGYSEKVVTEILDAQRTLLRQTLTSREEVLFRGLFRIIPTDRVVSVRKRGHTERSRISRLVLRLVPVRALRTELNRWAIGDP